MNFKKYNVSKNLFDKNAKNTANGFIQDTMLQSDGTTLAWNVFSVSEYIPVEGGAEYYLSQVMNAAFNAPSLCFYDSSKQLISSVVYQARYSFAMIAPTTAAYVRISYMNTQADAVMLNTGSTPLPYEPYSSEVWHDTPHYIHNTSTDTITTLPAVLYPTGTTATVGLKGNTTQNGTPTPDSPIMPQGTGERTGNLWDEDYTGININAIYRPLFVGDGEFTLSTNFKPNGGITDIFLLSGNVSSGINSSINGAYEGKNITAQSVNGYITIAYRANARPSSGSLPYCKTMLNTGSTPLPYEPYGYKIPISSASTTTPVYLGQVQSARRIFKLVLTGQENWKLQAINSYGIANLWITLPKNYVNQRFGLSSHFTLQTTVIIDTKTEGFYLTSGDVLYIRINATSASTANELKSYLAAQYAAGTPVTIWYVLATPTTGIVNEPLMRIGDYADTLSGVSIPVTAGGDTLSVGTTVQPSEVTVNYKGWHPVADVHERDNGAWT